MESKLQNKHNVQLEEDQNLWCALKLGDPAALNKLFTKYYENLYFYGLKLTGSHNQVIDSIQDVFVNIWKTKKKISQVTNVKAYLCTSLRNNLLKPDRRDIFIRTGITNKLNRDYCFDISSEDIYFDNETQLEKIKIIEDLLADLSPKQKEIIYLKFYCNYSNIEISRVLSIKQQSVANRLMRTIKILRKKR